MKLFKACLAGMLLTVAACGNTQGEKSDLLIGQYPGPDAAPLFIAIDRGFFKDEGLNVKTEAIQAPQAVLGKLANGSMDVVLGSYVTILTIQAQGTAKFKYIADSYEGAEGGFGVMVAKESPLKQAADLKGKRIGVNALKGIGVLTMNTHLREAGLDPARDVQYVEVPTTNWLASLAKGDVAAIWMTDPYVSEAKAKLGATMLVDTMSGSTKGMPITGWAATEQWVSKNPRTLAAFQRAMARAQRIAATDRSAVTKVIPTYTKIPADTAAKISLGNYPTTLSADRIQRVADLMARNGFLTTKPDVASMIVPSKG